MPCVMRLISQTRKTVSKLSGMSPSRHESLRISVADVNMRFSGKRMLKSTGSQFDKQIEDFRTTLLDLRKAFLDEATITAEITALQILDDVGIISANVGKISSQLGGMATQLKW